MNAHQPSCGGYLDLKLILCRNNVFVVLCRSIRRFVGCHDLGGLFPNALVGIVISGFFVSLRPVSRVYQESPTLCELELLRDALPHFVQDTATCAFVHSVLGQQLFELREIGRRG